VNPTATPGPLPAGLAHIDRYLGPAETRFFGSGYRRVGYRLGPSRVAGPATSRFDAAVICPPDWSRKSGVAQRPHLSTLDALILSAEAAGRQLGAHTGRLRAIEIRAGSEPFEDELDRVPVESSLASQAGGDLRFDVSVANMRVRLTVDGGAARSTPLYGVPYDSRRQCIDAVELDGSRARASVTLEAIDGDWRAAPVSMIDGFVVTLQLGQALLYALDGLARGESNTLWMRRTTITDEAGHLAGPAATTATAEISDTAVLTRRGEHWRTATLSGELLGVKTRCAVTHRLHD
jgi:avirulence D protein (AvrD)